MNTNKLKTIYLSTVSTLIETTNLPHQEIHDKATKKAALAVWQEANGTIDWGDCLIECFCITGALAEAIGLSK